MRTPSSDIALYHWRGVNAKGHTVAGTQIAPTKDQLQQSLALQRIRATRISRADRLRRVRRQLSADQTAQFTRFLSTLLQAGLALNPALRLMQQTTSDVTLLVLIHRLIASIESGASLHQALAHSQMCDQWLIHIVKAAESIGQLDTLLAQQASHREQVQAQGQHMRTALTYPLFVLIIAVGATLGLLRWVVPTFEDVFASLNTELPWLTQQVLTLSRQLQSHGPIAFMVIMCMAGVWLWVYRRSSRLQQVCDDLMLSTPWLGGLIQRAQLARFCTTLHALTQASVQMDQALNIVAPLCSHRTFQRACQDVIAHMLRGQALSEAMQLHPRCFDPLCIQMCALGEESGTLAPMLHKLSLQYDQATQDQLKRLGLMMEPAIMSVLGLLCGGLIAALYLPIFQMGQLL
jgi:type IV pilus assembly protein PilC